MNLEGWQSRQPQGCTAVAQIWKAASKDACTFDEPRRIRGGALSAAAIAPLAFDFSLLHKVGDYAIWHQPAPTKTNPRHLERVPQRKAFSFF